jgi:transposase InsO family protein
MASAIELSSGARNRLEWFIWHDVHGKDVGLTCRHFGIPRKSWYKWVKRFDPEHLRLLEDRPRAPKNRRHRDITYLQTGRILELRRRNLRYGKEKISRIYATEYGETISSWKVQKVIEKSGLYYHPAKNARTSAKRRKAEKKKRIATLKVKKRTGFLFRADTVVRYWLNTKRFIFTAVDSTSKLAFAHMYTTHSSKNAADFLRRLHALTEGKIENVQTDNGSEFHGEFDAALKDLGIPHYWSRVRTPKDNAMNERFNRTLDEEFLRMGNMVTDPIEFNRRLTEWLVEYNFRRPHQTLGYMSPINFIYKHERLLPMYPSSTVI